MRIISYLIIILSVVLNPFFIGSFFTKDGIQSVYFKVLIIIFEIILLLIGIWLHKFRDISRQTIEIMKIDVFFLLIKLIPILIFLFIGGLIVLINDEATVYYNSILILLILILVFYFIFLKLKAEIGKQIYYHIIFSFIIFFITIYLFNYFANYFIPTWPARDLHGVDPKKVLYSQTGDNKFVVNSWGQRDLERSITKDIGVKRILFIGDSFMEESSSEPLNLSVQKKLRNSSVEVINLGVSATGPDEYYYRLKKIGLKLHPDVVCVFLYEMNDYYQEVNHSLVSYAGILSVSPRDGFLNYLGLDAVNFLLTNFYRPIIRAWGQSNELVDMENEIFDSLKSGDSLKIYSTIQKYYPLDLSNKVYSYEKLIGLFKILSNPDNGKFRSYYLNIALNLLLNSSIKPLKPNDDTYVWIRSISKLCAENNIKLNFFIIPEAFQVDQRMIKLWEPYCNMKLAAHNNRLNSEIMCKKLNSEGIFVCDLFKVLNGEDGIYLNPDGHWSDKGIDIVSDSILRIIEN